MFHLELMRLLKNICGVLAKYQAIPQILESSHVTEF